MNDEVSQAEIDAAEAYEALFVSALFEQWTAGVLEAARVGPGQRVLDVACGTGVLAREAAMLTKSMDSVAGLDPNAGMLAVAEGLAPRIDWRQGAAESLPFPDESFDSVVSQFGLMFFADRSRAVREMLRVVVPGGHLAIAVWDSLERTPGYACEVELLNRTAGRRAGDALRAPFVLGDRMKLAELFEDAGVMSARIETRPGRARFPSIRSMVEADLRGWLPVMGVNLTEEKIDQVLQEAEKDLGSFVTAEGQVEFDAPAHIVSTVKRH